MVSQCNGNRDRNGFRGEVSIYLVSVAEEGRPKSIFMNGVPDTPRSDDTKKGRGPLGRALSG